MSRVIGIGVDLTQMPRLRRVVARWDERFLQRVFTEQEIAYCRRRRDPIPHFAARFAAKEATLKALGTGLRMGVNWRELEVRRERGGPDHGAERPLPCDRGGQGRPTRAALAHPRRRLRDGAGHADRRRRR
jgi:holo-[acyl-carrier-protein] synthase